MPRSKPKPNGPSKKKKPATGGGRISPAEGTSTCKCGRTDVQEPLHFDYTSRLELTQLTKLTKGYLRFEWLCSVGVRGFRNLVAGGTLERELLCKAQNRLLGEVAFS